MSDRVAVNRSEFLGAAAAAGASLARLNSTACASASGAVREIAGEPQHFLNDWIIDRLVGLRRVLHQPEKQRLIQHSDGSPWGRGDCYSVVNLRAPVGEMRAELQDDAGQPIPGFHLADCTPTRGDGEVLSVRWQNSPQLGKLAGKPVRVRFRLTNGALYTFQLA